MKIVVQPRSDSPSHFPDSCNYKQCRLSASAQSPFCSHHAKLAQLQPPEEDHSAFLLRPSQDFQTAQGVNFTLANLFELVAKNRISPRRAAVLTYIGSLLLRTHPAIDSDREAGITDPAKSKSDFPVIPDLDPTKKPSWHIVPTMSFTPTNAR